MTTELRSLLSDKSLQIITVILKDWNVETARHWAWRVSGTGTVSSSTSFMTQPNIYLNKQCSLALIQWRSITVKIHSCGHGKIWWQLTTGFTITSLVARLPGDWNHLWSRCLYHVLDYLSLPSPFYIHYQHYQYTIQTINVKASTKSEIRDQYSNDHMHVQLAERMLTTITINYKQYTTRT